jgi:shikimate kinase
MNIVLTGYRGTGKSAVARLLARKLGWPVAGLDSLIVEREGRSINDIVAARGWEYFRDAESAVVAETAVRDRLIIDTGGGAILRQENVRLLRQQGIVFWLKADPAAIAARIHHDTGRPALTRGKTFLEEIEDVLRERTPLYHGAADFEIATDGRTLEDIADEVLGYFQRLDRPGAPALSQHERTRYLRQLLISGWGQAGQERLRSATVFIAGAGGLGCPAATYLAAAGAGKIRLCDFGSVELSNLNRQILYTEADIGKQKAVQAAATCSTALPLKRACPWCMPASRAWRARSPSSIRRKRPACSACSRARLPRAACSLWRASRRASSAPCRLPRPSNGSPASARRSRRACCSGMPLPWSSSASRSPATRPARCARAPARAISFLL